MRILMTLLALSLFTACGVDGDDAGATSDGVSTTSQALGDWMCSQRCSSGRWEIGLGSTADEAYQDLPGCGPGGGTIECNVISDEKEPYYWGMR